MDKAKSFEQYKKRNKLSNAFVIASSMALNGSYAYLLHVNNLESSLTLTGAVTALFTATVFSHGFTPKGKARFSNNIEEEERTSFSDIIKKANLTDKEIWINDYVNSDDTDIAFVKLNVLKQATLLELNKPRYDLFDIKGENFIRGHELSHIINNDAQLMVSYYTAVGLPALAMAMQSISLNSPAITMVGMACMGVQFLLSRKLSRQTEERADVEGAFLSGVSSKDLEKSFDTYRKQANELNYPKNKKKHFLLDTHPTDKKSFEVTRRVLG